MASFIVESSDSNNNETFVPDSNISKIINLAIHDTFNEKMNILENINKYTENTYGIVSSPLLDQLRGTLNNEIIQLITTYCKIIDYTDMVHDFRSCNTHIERILQINNLQLCSALNNINIANSHNIQKDSIIQIIDILQSKGIVIPNLEESFFIPKESIKKYIDEKRINSKRFYLESGRNPDVTSDMIQPKTAYAIYDGCAHSGVAYEDINSYNNPIRSREMQHLISYVDNGLMNNFIEGYKITLYGGFVESFFNPLDMTLIVKASDKYIKIQLTNNVGITVNSIIHHFQIEQIFPNAERGVGNDTQTFQMIETNITNNADPLYIFLITCLKTVCDKIVSTELPINNNFIGHITTVDSYLWAGIYYKYLIGEYRILPTVYEQVKNGWNVRPGIYDMSKEISDRIIRALHLYNIFGLQIPAGFINSFTINPGIIISYSNLINNYYNIYTNCYSLIKHTKTFDNVFIFLSAYKIYNEYKNIYTKILQLKQLLEDFSLQPNEITLLKIPLLEDVLKISSAEQAMNNQQTLLYSDDIKFVVNITPDEQQFLDNFFRLYKDPTNNPTTFISNDKSVLKNDDECQDNVDDSICTHFLKAQKISLTKSSSEKIKDFNMFQALQDGLIDITVINNNSNIIFALNLHKIEPKNKSEMKELFTSSVLELNENNDDVYVLNKTQYTVVGPLELEILWIISIAIILRPNNGTARKKESELTNRIQQFRNYSKILFNYLKPDIFTDETYLINFENFFVNSVLNYFENKVNNTTIETYINIWSMSGLLPITQHNYLYSFNITPNQLNIGLTENTSIPKPNIKLGGKHNVIKQSKESKKHLKNSKKSWKSKISKQKRTRKNRKNPISK